jgi:rSAM/selenodomain-associated transferase 1
MVAGERCVIVFVKYPVPGTVKTRLAKTIGNHQAAIVYKKLVEDTVRMVAKTDEELCIFFAPSKSRLKVEGWLGQKYRYLAQRGTDLGSRMRNAFIYAFQLGYSKVVIVGSDLPDLPASTLVRAFGALENNEIVLGPSVDGGYYLIGLTSTRFHDELFRGISWSTDAVLSSTLAIISRCNLRSFLLPPGRDIDTWSDLKSFYRRNRHKGKLRSIEYIKKNSALSKKLMHTKKGGDYD